MFKHLENNKWKSKKKDNIQNIQISHYAYFSTYIFIYKIFFST